MKPPTCDDTNNTKLIWEEIGDKWYNLLYYPLNDSRFDEDDKFFSLTADGEKLPASIKESEQPNQPGIEQYDRAQKANIARGIYINAKKEYDEVADTEKATKKAKKTELNKARKDYIDAITVMKNWDKIIRDKSVAISNFGFNKKNMCDKKNRLEYDTDTQQCIIQGAKVDHSLLSTITLIASMILLYLGFGYGLCLINNNKSEGLINLSLLNTRPNKIESISDIISLLFVNWNTGVKNFLTKKICPKTKEGLENPGGKIIIIGLVGIFIAAFTILWFIFTPLIYLKNYSENLQYGWLTIFPLYIAVPIALAFYLLCFFGYLMATPRFLFSLMIAFISLLVSDMMPSWSIFTTILSISGIMSLFMIKKKQIKTN